MKQIIKALVPPICLSAINSLRKSRSADPVFLSYEQAIDSCGTNGYQASDVVEVVVEKNVIYRQKIFASRTMGLESVRTIVGVGAIDPQPTTLRVLDFGGGGGSHFSIVRAAFGAEKDIKWNVVETEAMAKAANPKLAGGGLKFFSDIDCAVANLGEVDLVFTSGALQYTPDPLAFLAKLIAVKAKHIFVTRTAFNDGEETIVSVQTAMLSANGPGRLPSGFNDHEVRLPVTFASRREAERLITKTYNIRFSIEEDKASYSVRGKPFNMFGYFCDLKN
jgi:putative methyltransferase (TIGR04325 family)